jgi:hypothetical protein
VHNDAPSVAAKSACMRRRAAVPVRHPTRGCAAAGGGGGAHFPRASPPPPAHIGATLSSWWQWSSALAPALQLSCALVAAGAIFARPLSELPQAATRRLGEREDSNLCELWARLGDCMGALRRSIRRPSEWH